MCKFHVSLLASAVLVFGIAAGLARADMVIVPTSAMDNGHYGSQGVSKTLDGSGLSNAALVTNALRYLPFGRPTPYLTPMGLATVM